MGLRSTFAEYAPLFFSLVFCFIAAYFDGVMQVLTERRARQISNLPPLPDLAHSILPYIRFWQLNDIYIALVSLAFILRFIGCPSLRLKVLRRFLFLEAIILLFRGISVVLTTLSIPLDNCVSDATGNPFVESLYILIYVHHTCADLLFSGHTATYTLIALFWSHYTRGQEWKACGVSQSTTMHYCEGVWLGLPESDAVGDPNTFHWTILFVWLFHLLGIFFILSTHFHYSIDAYIGFLLTTLTFHLYHYYIKSSLEAHNYTAAFFRWFESIRTHDAGQAAAVEGETGEGGDEGEGRLDREAMSVLYGVSLVDGLKRKRPEEVGRLALATAIAEMEHRDHVIVTGETREWY